MEFNKFKKLFIKEEKGNNVEVSKKEMMNNVK